MEENLTKISFQEFKERTYDFVYNFFGSPDTYIELFGNTMKNMKQYDDFISSIPLDTIFYEVEHIDQQFLTYAVGYVNEYNFKEEIEKYDFSLISI